jgi:hypothetical protein
MPLNECALCQSTYLSSRTNTATSALSLKSSIVSNGESVGRSKENAIWLRIPITLLQTGWKKNFELLSLFLFDALGEDTAPQELSQDPDGHKVISEPQVTGQDRKDAQATLLFLLFTTCLWFLSHMLAPL